ncbi:MAG: hypothetical protein HYR94_01660 [Chloroflexi bacterium]|nr:hypothetical protein [Chloroflexota bacterium]
MSLPISFGESEKEQLDEYFASVEKIRKFVRSAETDNFPTFESAKSKLEQDQT